MGNQESLYPSLRHIFADGGYAGPKLNQRLAKIGKWTIQIVKRSDTANGSELLPRRWVVERTFAWLGRCRRITKDFEVTVTSAPPGSSSAKSGCSHGKSLGTDNHTIIQVLI